MHLRTTNAGVCLCAYDQYAHMQGVTVEPTEENKRRNGDQNGR
jgi:hypothetical protein